MQDHSRGRLIFNLKILWDNKSSILPVHENDEPDILSKTFVESNGLPKSFSKLIENEIEQKIEELLNKELPSDSLSSINTELDSRFSIDRLITKSKSPSPSRMSTSRKLNQYEKIFQILTPNDAITPESMACLDLKSRLCRILTPLLIDLNMSDDFVDFMTFCSKMDALSSVLSQEDIEYLMNFQLDLKEISPCGRFQRYKKNMLSESTSKIYNVFNS